MKKHLVLTVGLAVLSTSAFATKARMEALGENANRGSFFIQDNRNVFRNAAHVNSMKNYVVTEWGTVNNAAADSSTAPKAEGGFFREAGSFSYGLYLGSDIGSNAAIRNDSTGVTGEAGFIDPANKLDLFVGGDAGVVEWGARFGHARNKQQIVGQGNQARFTATAKMMQAGLGVIFGDLQGYVNLDLQNESKGANHASDNWKADTGTNVGLNYTFMGWTGWVDYYKQGSTYNDAAQTTNRPEWEQVAWSIGAGKAHEVASGSRVLTSLAYAQTGTEQLKTLASNTAKTLTTERGINLVLGFEADATSWLTLRGSVKQDVNVFASTTAFSEASTNVNAGATLNFGKLKLDGSIGTEGDARGAGAEHSKEGLLALDTVFSRVGVSYWF